MRLPESILAGGPWAGVALVQVTLVSLLGLLAWLATRRGGPALRGAVLLAALVGLLVAPRLAAVAPVWLPLPDCFCPAGAGTAPTDPGDGVPASPTDPAVFAILVGQPPGKAQPNPEDLAGPAGTADLAPAEAEAVIINLSLPPEDATPAVRHGESSRPSWPLAGVLTAMWLLGAIACVSHALARLGLLYRSAWRARPVPDENGADGLPSLVERYGLPAVPLRESPAVSSPITLGLFRPVILLPQRWRDWPAAQRVMILGHELAHVRRRDFLAGLVAELASCLFWFHPLVRWLAGRLRLEQEYAADAWVVSASADSTDYVRCLARLALAQGQGRGSLAPAFWRRRPEILRRIDMLRRNPKGLCPRLGKRAAWAVVLLAAAACLGAAGVGPLQSADTKEALASGPEVKARPTADPHGDPLPENALARLGTTRWRHGAEITFVSFGPDGKTLLTAGRDDTIRLWELASGKEIRRFVRPKPTAPGLPAKGDKPGADEKFRAAAVRQLMAGGSNDRGGFSVAVAPDGRTLAAAGGNIVQLWALETGKELRQLEGPASGLAGLLFSPDGRTLAARADDDTLILWETETGKEISRIKPPPRERGNGIVLILGGNDTDPPGMAFTPDGKLLAAAATDYKEEAASHSVKLWDVASGKESRRIKVRGGAGVSAVAIAPDGKLLAYGAGNAIHLCEADTGDKVREVKAPDGGTAALVFSPDGKTLAARGRTQRIRLWETETGKELYQLGDAETAPRDGGLAIRGGFSGPEARALAMSPDGKRLASAAGSTLRLWETATGKELALLDGHRKAPSAVSVAADGKSVVSWGPDRVIRRWEAATGKSQGAFPAPAGTTLAAFSSDGGAVALSNADNTIRLHESATGKELHRLKGHAGGTAALAFAPDGKVLASRGTTDNTIRFYDVARGAEMRPIVMRPGNSTGPGGGVIVIGGPARAPRGTGPGLAFSPDGKLVAANGAGSGSLSNTLILFDVAAGKELRKIASAQPVASFAFAPDGRVLATEHPDRTITLWEVASGKERGRLGKPVAERLETNRGMAGLTFTVAGLNNGSFTDPAGPVGLSFSPDGRALATRGSDQSVRVWDVAAGKEIGQLRGHGGRVETVAFAPDGKRLASSSTDTTILLWDAAGPLKDLSQPQAVELPAAELDALWGVLAGEDAAKAQSAIQKLAGGPRQAAPLLGERLSPAARVDPRKIDGLIAGLEDEKFAVRDQASANLLKVGEQAVPALRKVLTSSPPLETRKRVEALLDTLTSGTLTAEQLRQVRAVEALERMGTPEARRLLQALAEGAPAALPTREAKAALDRLAVSRP